MRARRSVFVTTCVSLLLLTAATAGAEDRSSGLVGGDVTKGSGTVDLESSAVVGASDHDGMGLRSRPRVTEFAPGDTWQTGPNEMPYTYNCTVIGSPYTEPLGLTYVGYLGNISTTPVSPAVNQVYYVLVGWGVSGYPCGNGGAYTHVEIGLPANTTFAISNTNKVRCWYKSVNSSNYSDFTNDVSCPQVPKAGMKGGASFDPATGEGAWPTATGSAFEIWVPVKTSQPLNGLVYNSPTPCPACLIAGVWMIDGVDSPWTYPRKGVAVSGSSTSTSPYIIYPVPSVRNMQDPSPYENPTGEYAYTETVAFIYTQGTTGVAQHHIRSADGTASAPGPLRTLSSPGDYEHYEAWNVTPNDRWIWKACYDPTGPAPQICGAEQTFETPARAETIDPNTSIKTGPSGYVSSTRATFTFDSNESNVIYQCSRDGSAYAPCKMTEPTYTGLSQGKHTLRVRAVDQWENIDDTPAVRTWTVDTVKPKTSLLSGPPNTTASRSATFKFRSNEPGRFQCKIDNKPFQRCSSPKAYTGLSRGRHTFKVRAVDRAGNVDGTPASKTWTIV